MRIKQLLCASATLILAMSGAIKAEQRHTVTQSEIAATHCAAELARFEALKSDAWNELALVEIDPEIDTATTEAFNKFGAAAIALADYFGSFIGFADAENQNPAYFALARTKYDLAMCLIPTEPERDLVVELARSTTDAPNDEIRAILFKAFDQFDCMQVAEASDAIFRLEPSSQPFSIGFEAITSAHMRVCN